MNPEDVSEKLSAALAGRLALQMSVSSLPVVEEWMDTGLTRWLDSVPLPMEMPDGSAPALVVSLGADGNLVKWSSSGRPEGIIPKLSDYLRRAGAVPGDFAKVDQAGQALEPAEVGSWIEIRPGSLETGWFFEDRMAIARVRDLLGEGAWMGELGSDTCVRVARGVGAKAAVEVTIPLAGADAGARSAAAQDVFRRFGFALDDVTSAGAGDPVAVAVRARGGAVESARLVLDRPSGQAAQVLASLVGVALVPAVGAVERAIASGGPVEAGVEKTAAGAQVIVSFVAGSGTTAN